MSERQRWVVAALALLLLKTISVLWLDARMDRVSGSTACGRLSHCSGDSSSYLEPVDNLLQTGSYYWNNGHSRVLAGRLPHYGLLYGAFRMPLSEEAAKDALVVLQILLDVLAGLAIAALATRWSGSTGAGWCALIIVGLSLHGTHHSLRLVPESLAISVMALLLLAIDEALERPRRRWVWAAGFAGALLIVLKPYVFPLVMFYAATLAILQSRKAGASGYASQSRTLLSFLLPALALLLPWTVRNAVTLGAFVPLQQGLTAGYAYGPEYFAYRRYLGSWGATAIWWDKRSAGCHFEPEPGYPCEFILPSHAFSTGASPPEVESARRLLLATKANPGRSAEAAEAFERLATAYKRDRPFSYLVLAPIRLSAGMLTHSGSYFLPPDPTAAGGVIKISQSLLYYLVLCCGCIGLAASRRTPRTWFALVVPLYLLLLFGWVLRLGDYRYFDLAWPALVVAAAALVPPLFRNEPGGSSTSFPRRAVPDPPVAGPPR
jgi:hypothetical protein